MHKEYFYQSNYIAQSFIQMMENINLKYFFI